MPETLTAPIVPDTARTLSASEPTSDFVWGAKAIGAEIGRGERDVFYLLERGLIPARKVGGKWCASRRQLRADLVGADAAA